MTDLPPGWTVAPLADLVEILDHMRVPISAKERASRPGNVPYYGATGRVGYIDRSIFNEDLVLLGEDGVQFFDTSKPKAYCISGPAWVNNHAHVLRPRPGIEPRFLCHYLNQVDYEGFANGTTRLKLTQAAMNRIPVVLPSSAEQRRIVAAFDDKISQLNSGLSSLQLAYSRTSHLRRSSRHQATLGAFAARAGVTKLMDALQEGGLADVPLPTGWRWGTLADLVAGLDAGKSFTCEPRRAGPGEWGVIKVSAMTWGEFRPEENKALPPGHPVNPLHRINPGDLLVSRANTEAYVGASVLVRELDTNLLLSDKSLRLRVMPGVNREWLLHILASPFIRRQISRKATGTKESMRNISQRALLEVNLPIAPESAMEGVVVELSKWTELAERSQRYVREAITRSSRLRRALLAEAFAGQLVEQAPDDESAAELLARIKAERASTQTRNKKRSPHTPKQAPAHSPSLTDGAYRQEELPL